MIADAPAVRRRRHVPVGDIEIGDRGERLWKRV